MTVSRIIGLVLFAGLCVLAWYAYDQITVLRRSIFWEFRYLVLGIVVFLALSIVQWVWGKVNDRLAASDNEEHGT